MPGFNIEVQKEGGASADCKVSRPDSIKYPASLLPKYNIETIRTYRWLFEILKPFNVNPFNSFQTKASGNLLTYLKKCERPNLEFDEILIHNGPRVMYRPGKFKCTPINMEFYEVLGPNSDTVNAPAIRIYEYMKKLMFKASEGVYSSYQDYSFDAKLSLLNGDGGVVHVYDLYGCIPLKVSPSELNYESDTLTNISVTIRYVDFKES